MSKDYHDYVFKDGKLVGDFDNMYRNSADIPWHQDQAAGEWFNEVGLTMLKVNSPYEKILEVGCGLGYFTQKLVGLGSQIDATDISEEAIRKARQINSDNINFFVSDIRKEDCAVAVTQQYNLVVIKDLFWYVFDQMPGVVNNIKNLVTDSGYLYISQSFPNLNNEFVGKHIINSPEKLVSFFVDTYKPVFQMSVQRIEYINEGPMFHYLGVKK
jgi:2-polyprenyl-3-methyl-5-hydroxy-6-metoxy-1,4-benzoquinol methylase